MSSLSALHSKQKFITIIQLNCILLCILLAQYITFVLLKSYYIRFVEGQLIVFFIISIFSAAWVKKNWLDLYVMFLGMFFLFLLSRPFIHFLNGGKLTGYSGVEWFQIRNDFHFTQYTMIHVNFILAFSLIFLNLGYCFGELKNADNEIKHTKKFIISKYLNLKIGYFLFTIGTIAFLIKVKIYVDILTNFGYFYLYSGNYSLPVLVRVFDDFFIIGYAIIISNLIPKKQAYGLTILFLGLFAMMLLAGMRGEFFTIVLGCVWTLQKIYKLKVKLWVISIFGTVFVLLAELATQLKNITSATDEFSMLDTIELFFHSQGVSVLVIGFVIEFEDQFSSVYNGFRQIISPLVNLALALTGNLGSRAEMGPETVYSLGERLQYFTNPALYTTGGGTGSSFVAELYSLGGLVPGGGLIFVALGSFLLAYFMSFVNSKLIYKPYGIFLTTLIVPALFWMSRANFLYPLQKYLFGLMLIIFLIIFSSLLINKKSGIQNVSS